MQLTHSQISKVLNQLQGSLGGRITSVYDEKSFNDVEKSDYTTYLCFVKLGLSETQCKMFGLDPRGFQIAVSVYDDSTGKITRGEDPDGPLIGTFKIDAADDFKFLDVRFRSAVSESKKRGTGVYLNRITS